MSMCEECGGDPVNHPLEKLGVAMDMVLLRATRALPRPKGRGALARALSVLFEASSRVGLSELLDGPDDKTLLLDRMLWEEAKKRGIRMREVRPLGSVRNSFTATLPDGRVLDFDGIPHMGARAVWWINDKPRMRSEFAQADIPVARGGTALTLRGARNIFKELAKPVVVKPAMGSASRHTSMHVETLRALERAFASASRVSPLILIEEELPGSVYRPTLVGGSLIATLRRDQPYVVGDGTRTVAELVAMANAHPSREGPYFGKLSLAPPALSELAYQGLAPESVPAMGRRVRLHQKINWALGGTTCDVTETVHPDNRKLFERVAVMLKAPLVGIDFIAKDIGTSWKEQRCGIIECNDMPYFDNHHLPFEGRPRDIAGPVWDLVLTHS